MLTVNAHTLGQVQRCRRLYRISLTHRVRKWHPKSLLSACLRRAVFGLSSGLPVQTVSDVAVQYFLASARSPGLDLPHGMDTYTYIMDLCAVIRNVLEYLSRLTLLELKEVSPIKLSEDVQWSFLSHKDESGVLHRWQFVDYLPKDIVEELHGWGVFGDIAAYDSPMVLHLVAVGKREGNHQVSPWCRVYAHPHVANLYQFNKKSGAALEGDWKPTYFSGNSKNKPEDWVDWMERDNTVLGLVGHYNVGQVDDYFRKSFVSQVLFEAAQMVIITPKTDPTSLPMARSSACDKPFICPHQTYCYSRLGLDDVGIYTKIERKAKLEEVPCGVI